MSRARTTTAGRITAAAVLLVLASPVLAQQASAPAGGLIRPGEAPQLSLVYSGDVIGYLDPCG
jgi:hypothetical protein